MWGIPFSPRIEMRGYPEFVDDRIRINPSIYRWDSPSCPYDPLSVSTDYSYLKTDESVRIKGGIYTIPHVETRGYSDYSDLVDNRIQLNLPIYRWGNTIYPHNPLSVSTDYSYLKTDESVRSMYRMSILRGVKTLVFSFKKIRLALDQSK